MLASGMSRTLACVALAAALLVIVLARSFSGTATPDGVPPVEPLDATDTERASLPQADSPPPVVVDEIRIPEGYPPDRVLASRPSTQPGRVSGVVLGGRDGATPLASANVRLTRLSTDRDERQDTTDANGRFAILDVEPAVWTVDVSAESHGDVRRITLLPRENTGIELEIVLPIWRDMTIQLVGPNGPIRDFRALGLDNDFAHWVSVQTGVPEAQDSRPLGLRAASPGPRRAGSTRSSENLGRFDVGAYVRPTDVVHVLLGQRVIASRPLPGDERVVELPVSPEDVRRVSVPLEVRVVAKVSRQPIADALVEIRSFPTSDPFRVERTDASGIANWKDAPPVGLNVRVLAHGFVPRTRREEAARDGATEFELDAGYRLAGRISAQSGGVTVSLWKRPPDRELLGPTIASTDTDPSGAFDFGTILPGEYIVAALGAKSTYVRGSELASSKTFVLVALTAGDVVDAHVPYDAADAR